MIDSLRDAMVRLLGWLSPSGSVAEQTIKSGIWMALMNFLDRGLQLISIVILANLLAPADFGLMGIALLALSGLKAFSKLGLNDALIQDEEANVDEYLNTAWALQVGRALVITVVLIGAAPYIAGFFGEPRATDVLRVVAASPLLLGLRNPGIVYFQKNLDFHLEFLYRTSGSVAQFCVAVGYALVVPSVWALVFGFVTADVVRLVVSYAAHDYRPRPSFHLDRARDLISYGKWITGTSVLYFLYSQGDDAVVGWLVGASALAFYQNAYRLSNAPATELSQVINEVMFPAYSAIQDDPAAIRDAYFRTLQITGFIAFPAAFGIAAVAPVFVDAFMGDEWLPMVRAMQLLAIYGLLRSVGKTMGPVWKTLDRPDYVTKLSALRVTLIALTVVPMTHRFGIEGTALVVVGIYVFPMLPLDTYVLVNSIQASYARFARELAYPLVASTLMFLAVVLVRQQVALSPGVLEFVVLVFTGVVGYAVATGALVAGSDWGIENNLKSLVNAVT
jgi:PST family polysaccharide transporter/lipopolysaccharide exporter